MSLFPPIEPFRSGQLAVDELHTLYWEECGNPRGLPVLFLHGGPGAGLSPQHRCFFNPEYYRIVLFDQRGAGRSTPLGHLPRNLSLAGVDPATIARAQAALRPMRSCARNTS